MTIPNNWVEEDREDVVTAIVDGMVTNMTFEEMRSCIWDTLYDDLIWQEWPDLLMHAEDYAPELLEMFESSSKEDTSA